MSPMELFKKLSMRAWILTGIVFLISFQRAFVYIFPENTFPHTGCPYNWIKYAYFDTLLLLLFPLVMRHFKSLTKEKETVLLLAFLALVALSIVTHTYATLLLPAWFFVKLLGTALLFFALVLEARGPERETVLKALLYTLVIAATLQASIALLQFINQASIGLKTLGEGKVLCSSFPIKNGTAHLLRAQGTLDHPNHLGIFLVTGCAALFSLFLKAGKKERITLIIPFTLLLVALITTFSRASLFTLLITLILMTALLKKKSHPLLKLVIPLFILTFALFLPQIKSRGGIVNYNIVNRFADGERTTYMNDAFAMIKAHPTQGVGFHNYVSRIGEFSTDPHSDLRPLIVHNIFLLIFAELGLPALLLFLSLWALLLIRAWKCRHDTTTAIWGAYLFALLFYASCDVFLLSDQQGQLTLFLTFGLTLLAIRTAEPSLAKEKLS